MPEGEIPAKIEKAAIAVKSLAKAVPVYQDAVRPLAKQIGKAGGTVGEALNALLLPLNGLVWGFNQIADFLRRELPPRLQHIPAERLQAPPPYVAVPAAESLRYTADEPSLRDMYLNLLAIAMDAKTVSSAHPAFVEIIRQLVPDEARLLRFYYRTKRVPIIWLSAPGCVERFDRICDGAGILHRQHSELYGSNLERLNLIGCSDPPLGGDAGQMAVARQALEHEALGRKRQIEECTRHDVAITHGDIFLTPFGENFSVAVLGSTAESE